MMTPAPPDDTGTARDRPAVASDSGQTRDTDGDPEDERQAVEDPAPEEAGYGFGV